MPTHVPSNQSAEGKGEGEKKEKGKSGGPALASSSSPAKPAIHTVPKRPRILLGVTGSVAAVKGPELAVALARKLNADVRVVLTSGAEHFWDRAKDYDPSSWEDFNKLSVLGGNAQLDLNVDECDQSDSSGALRKIYVYLQNDDWKGWNRLGDPVLHIDLRDWADIALLSPLSANTLGKIATGLCDDTLSCCIRAWDFGHGPRPGKPLILAPAMNTAMWEHPLTGSQLEIIRSFWNNVRGENLVHVVDPQVKTLACGEVGAGALAELSDILRAARLCLEKRGYHF